MKNEEPPNKVMNVYGYPTGLIEEPVVILSRSTVELDRVLLASDFA